MRSYLHGVLKAFHAEAHAGEQKLREAMREYERSCGKKATCVA